MRLTGRNVEAFQNPWELVRLLDIIEEPRTILEVGVMHGGTLQYWVEIASHVVVIDDQMRNADLWEAWADESATMLDLLHGDSRDPNVIAKAEELGTYEFVFIDADHSYDAVHADWLNYSPLGHIVALHDILPRPGYGVSEVWAMIKQGPRKWVEICHNETLPGNEGPCGIGVVWM